MKVIKKLTYQAIVDYLHDARYRVRWVSPSLTIEIAHSLSDLTDRNIEVCILTDTNPDRFRHYEGEIEAIELLKNNPDIKLKKATDLGIGIIIVDDAGYAFFNPLRAFENDGDRYNAFKLDQETIRSLESLLFDIEDEISPDLFEQSESEQVKESLEIEDVTETALEYTKKELQKDPPLKLDLKRLINVYRSRFQIVELTFSGSKLHIKKVKLPKNALPFTDTRLKNTIESQLRLFSDISKKDFFQPYFDLKKEYDHLKDQYITYIKTREKNIIKKENKPAFEKEYMELADNISEIKEDLKAKLQEEIIGTKASIRNNLKQFFISNPTETLSVVEGTAREMGAEQQANDIVSKIHFPSAKDLVSKLEIEKFYYDLTWEDLNDEEVINEFKEKGLIDEDEMSGLKSMSKAFEIENSN